MAKTKTTAERIAFGRMLKSWRIQMALRVRSLILQEIAAPGDDSLPTNNSINSFSPTTMQVTTLNHYIRDWITDRTPEQEDADGYGMVEVLLLPGKFIGSDVHWHDVGFGAPWRHTGFHRFLEKHMKNPPFPDSHGPDVSSPPELPRRIVSVTRTVWTDQRGEMNHTIDAVAADGTAWWMVPGEVAWTQLPQLPQEDLPEVVVSGDTKILASDYDATGERQ